MLSTYARKKMLVKAAGQFTEDQVHWLAAQPIFNEVCDTCERLNEIVSLGKTLLRGRKAVHRNPVLAKPDQNFNPVTIPPFALEKTSLIETEGDESCLQEVEPQ